MAAKSGGVEGCKIDMLLSTILGRKQSKLQLSLIYFLIQPPIDWPTTIFSHFEDSFDRKYSWKELEGDLYTQK